ncbi:hypothetical protein EPUS_00272 [Endocarpon pusillum Z07020]|uniref:Uncharacterized protein n=1 Tax=Endocarpon pusillum (strain Z07020 / HMAS-L-300199) TaxID=1263415 RepID=U1HIQ6_ENDPU|nr:uncharacterized protein EPUS_00272 [Endocarpon pusillum Z07020]ERF70085.1 hypothetical protein EPUS_00272 [Endocarpon pusillum Z07020]
MSASEPDESLKIDNLRLPSTTNTITTRTMKDTKLRRSCPSGSPPHDNNVSREIVMSEDDKNAGTSMQQESPNEHSLSRIPQAKTVSDQSTNTQAPLSVSVQRYGRVRGRHGLKWVKQNYSVAEQLKREQLERDQGDQGECSKPTLKDGAKLETLALTTSSFPNSDKWSLENLPEILFYLKLPKSEYEGQPIELLEEDGKVVRVGKDEKPLRAFPILPRHISVEVEGWLVEAWRRLDPRITYADILDRQTECPERMIRKLDRNALSNRCTRECRKVLGSWTSYDKRDIPHRTDVEAIEKLSYQNILLNTILDVCPGRQDRLKRVRMVRKTGDDWGKLYAEPVEFDATDLHEKTFPLDHFILKSEVPLDGLHSMDDAMLASWELSLILQERARLHKQYSWATLPDRCKPVSWYDRTGGGKRVQNDTFDGGCPVCTWVPGRDQLLHKEWIDEVRSACSKPASRKPASRKPASRKPASRKPAAKKGASSGSSKRRKLDNGTGQNTSIDPAKDVDKECECCKETDAFIESGSACSKYPSDKFRRGEIKSYFRDPDHIGEAQVDDVVRSTEVHSRVDDHKRDSMTMHSAEHFGDFETGGEGSAEDLEIHMWAPIDTQPDKSQTSVSELSVSARSESGNIDTAPLQLTTTQIDLNGVGSHFIPGDAEYSSEHAQDQMVISNDGNMGPAYYQQSRAATGLLPFEGFVTNEPQDGDSEVQLWRGDVSTLQVQDMGPSVGASDYAFDEYASWAVPIDHQAPSFDVATGSNLVWTPTPQEYPPLGDDNNTLEQEIYGIGNQSQSSPANEYLWSQASPPANQSNSAFSPPTDTIPGLTNSIRTASDVSEPEITGSDSFAMEFTEITEMEKQANFSGLW